MKRIKAAVKGAVKQKAVSRKQPATMPKTARTQKTPEGERNDPLTEAAPRESRDSQSGVEKSRSDARPRKAAESPRDGSGDEMKQGPADDENGKPQPGGFHLKAEETRKERHEHEKGHVEAAAMLSRIPPAKIPGHPGSPPRLMQRRSVYERGNRYPLTHAPKS